jgi:hypothetical protein
VGTSWRAPKLLRQNHHLGGHAQAGTRFPRPSRKELLGHYRHRRGAQRCRGRHQKCPRQTGRTSWRPLRYHDSGYRYASRRPAGILRQPHEHAESHGYHQPEGVRAEDIEGLFLRRFKKDVQEQLGSRSWSAGPIAGPPLRRTSRSTLTIWFPATFASFDKAKKTGQLLFRVVLEKSLFSSDHTSYQRVFLRAVLPGVPCDRLNACPTITKDTLRSSTILATMKVDGAVSVRP